MLTAAAAWMIKSICNEVIHKLSVMEPEITKKALDKQCILATRLTCFTVDQMRLQWPVILTKIKSATC